MVAGVDDLAISLVGSAIYEGLRRPIANAKAYGARRHEIIRAYEGMALQPARSREKKIDGAMDDLIRVLGNEYGIYTTHVDRFLMELRTSAIPAAIYGQILCGKKTECLLPAFKTLYDTFSPLPFDCDELYSAYCTAINSKISEAIADPALADILRATADDLRKQIGAISEALQRSQQVEPLTGPVFLDARNRIARSIEQAHRDIPVETERGTRRIAINRLVIPARLIKTSVQMIKSDSPRSQEDSIPLDEFRKSLHRAVVLGDPGGGKSTLTQLTCFQMAKRLTLDTISNQRHIDDRDLKLPLKIVVRSFDRLHKNDPSYTIIDYLRDDLRPALDNDAALTEKFILQILSTGKALLLFDGLDEILEVGRRKDITATIEKFLHCYAACPSIITSRIIGYNDAPLADNFELFVLSRLSRTEIQKYAEKLIKSIGKTDSTPKSLATEFVKQTESTASDLRENPLLLGLMIYIFIERGDVPDNRPAIYQACSQLLFLKWDQRRDIIFEYPDDFELMDLFGYIAVKMFGNTDYEDGVHHDWLLNEINTFFEDWYKDRAKALKAAKALVVFLTGRAWVMCDVGPQVYKFTHRTFMEYFVARRLESESDGSAALLNHLYPRMINAEWDVVTHLALQISASNGPASGRTVDGLLLLLEESGRSAHQEFNILRFVSKSLDYLPVSESRFESITKSIMHRTAELGSRELVSAMSIYSVLVDNSKKKIDILSNLLTQHIMDELNSGVTERVKFARFTIANSMQGYAPEISYRRQTSSASPVVRHIFATLAGKDADNLNRDALVDVDMARLLLITHGADCFKLWKIFGLSLLFFDDDDLAISQYNGLRFLILRHAFDGVRSQKRGASEISTIHEIVDLIGKQSFALNVPAVRNDSAMRYAVESLEDLFRVSFNRFRSFSRSKRGSLPWLACLETLLAFVEAEADYLPDTKNIRYANRSRDTKKSQFKRSKLTSQFIPADIFIDIIVLADQMSESRKFQDWAAGEVSFVRFLNR